MDHGPIFIGGLAHSGKTPLRLMLSAHPNLALTRQTYMWSRFYNRYGNLSDPDNFERCLMAMLNYRGIQALQPDPENIRQRFGQGEPSYARLFALFHEGHAERLGKSRWGDQLGLVEQFADPIFAAFPAAKMIHMVRDPRHRQGAAKGLSRYRKGKIGWEIARWLHSINLMERNQKRYPDNYKVVRYETIVAQPEATIREICAFLNEDFLPGMIAGAHINFDLKEDDGNFSEEGRMRLKNKVSGKPMLAREIIFTQAYARQQMLAFNYRIETPQLSWVDRLLLYLVDWPMNRMGMFAWHIAEARSQVS